MRLLLLSELPLLLELEALFFAPPDLPPALLPDDFPPDDDALAISNLQPLFITDP
jgi:hypothetical protein